MGVMNLRCAEIVRRTQGVSRGAQDGIRYGVGSSTRRYEIRNATFLVHHHDYIHAERRVGRDQRFGMVDDISTRRSLSSAILHTVAISTF